MATKTLTLDDLGAVLNRKPISEAMFEDKDLGLRFKLRSLSEAEQAYIGMEVRGVESESERELLGMTLAIAFAVRQIERKAGKTWKPVQVERVEVDSLGEVISALPLEAVKEWSLTRVKAPLAEKIMSISEMSGGEALKLELFRPGGSGNGV